jgi:hypothetical protein
LIRSAFLGFFPPPLFLFLASFTAFEVDGATEPLFPLYVAPVLPLDPPLGPEPPAVLSSIFKVKGLSSVLI